MFMHTVLYKYIYWRVEYLANRLIIVFGVTLIWQKAVAAIYLIAVKLYWRYLNLVDGQKIAKSPPNKLRIIYGM